MHLIQRSWNDGHRTLTDLGLEIGSVGDKLSNLSNLRTPSFHCSLAWICVRPSSKTMSNGMTQYLVPFLLVFSCNVGLSLDKSASRVHACLICESRLPSRITRWGLWWYNSTYHSHLQSMDSTPALPKIEWSVGIPQGRPEIHGKFGHSGKFAACPEEQVCPRHSTH
jgi:hypothetical protein